MKAICASLFGLLVPALASAQSGQAERPRIAVAFLMGVSGADVAMIECCALRTPPVLVSLDDSHALTVRGGDARAYWTPRTSTFVQFEWSGEEDWHFVYPRPASAPFPFTSYEAERSVRYRNTTWAVGQSVELVTAGRLRPWIFGAVTLRRADERQRHVSVGFVDPSLRFEGTDEWERRQLVVSTGAGVRAYLTRRMFIGGELGWAVWGRQTCPECVQRRFNTRVFERGVARFITLRAAAGVLF